MTFQQTKAPALKTIHTRRVAEFRERLREDAPQLMQRVLLGNLKLKITPFGLGLCALFETAEEGQKIGTVEYGGYLYIPALNRFAVKEDE